MEPVQFEEAGEEDLDLRRATEILGFFLRAPRRRPMLAAAAFGLTLGLGILVAVFWPRTFQCDARILAQPNLVLPALDNPTRAVPHEADNPTRNAVDSIRRRDNIVGLIKQLDLVDRWEATRPPLLRVKDKVSDVFRRPTEEDRLRDMVGLLEKRLVVTADDSSITISIQWPDREMAFEIVSLLQANFLEARYDSNVNVIAEAIRILQERVKPQAAEVNAAFAELTRLEAARKADTLAEMTAPFKAGRPHREGVHASRASRDLAPKAPPDNLDAHLHARQVEAEEDRQLGAAQERLTEASAILGPQHPRVLALKEEIAQLSTRRAASKAADDTRSELAESAGRSDRLALSDALETASAPHPVPLDPRDDPKTAVARARLADTMATANELLSRIDAANIELDVTRAAFKYQYVVVRPPELPRKPLRPRVALVLLVTALFAPFFAFLVPGGIDLLRGRLIERWQIERGLKLDILGELLPP